MLNVLVALIHTQKKKKKDNKKKRKMKKEIDIFPEPSKLTPES